MTTHHRAPRLASSTAFSGLAALALLAAGCADVSSSDLFTSGMYADLSVTADGDGQARAFAVLRAGGRYSTTFVDLDGDDRLVASVGDLEKDMTPHQLLDWHGYSAVFGTDTTEEPFVIGLLRSLDEGAPHSEITLPAPFTLDTQEFLHRSEGFSIAWSTDDAGDAMDLSIDGTCIKPFFVDLDDTGSYTLPADSLEHLEGQDESCSVEVILRRTRAGTVDPGYGEGGRATGIQRRKLTVPSGP